MKLRWPSLLLLLACGGQEAPPHQQSSPTPTPAQIASVRAAVDAQVGRGLPPDAIRQVVMRHQGSLRSCFDGELTRVPDLKGGVTMTWTIAPDGSVSGATVAASTIQNTNVESCVLAQVKSWTFPPSERGAHVAAYPFKFGTAADAGSH